MSYDLCARKDKTFSGAVSRAETSRAVASISNVVANGPTGFVLQGSDEIWMEIDLESVSAEGDATETDTPLTDG